jgi:hypothetical protein
MSIQALIPLCRVRTEAHLQLTGRWGIGGEAALTVDGRAVYFSVSPVHFDLLGIFIEKARNDVPSQKWVPTGFLTVEELSRELTRRGGGDPRQPWYDDKGVIRAVYRLRLLIGAVLGPERTVDEWVKRFVENHPRLGYRLGTAPGHLELVILP